MWFSHSFLPRPKKVSQDLTTATNDHDQPSPALSSSLSLRLLLTNSTSHKINKHVLINAIEVKVKQHLLFAPNRTFHRLTKSTNIIQNEPSRNHHRSFRHSRHVNRAIDLRPALLAAPLASRPMGNHRTSSRRVLSLRDLQEACANISSRKPISRCRFRTRWWSDAIQARAYGICLWEVVDSWLCQQPPRPMNREQMYILQEIDEIEIVGNLWQPRPMNREQLYIFPRNRIDRRL